jgi:hypothetical protein
MAKSFLEIVGTRSDRSTCVCSRLQPHVCRVAGKGQGFHLVVAYPLTHAVTDAECDVGNARELSRTDKVEVFPRLTNCRCTNKNIFRSIFFFDSNMEIVVVDYDIRWNFLENRKS